MEEIMYQVNYAINCRICNAFLQPDVPGRNVCEDCRKDLCRNGGVVIGDIGKPATPYPGTTGDPIPPLGTTICGGDK